MCCHVRCGDGGRIRHWTPGVDNWEREGETRLARWTWESWMNGCFALGLLGLLAIPGMPWTGHDIGPAF